MGKHYQKSGHLDNLRLQAIAAAGKGDYGRAIDLAKRYSARWPDDVRVLDFLAGAHQ